MLILHRSISCRAVTYQEADTPRSTVSFVYVKLVLGLEVFWFEEAFADARLLRDASRCLAPLTIFDASSLARWQVLWSTMLK